MDTFKVGLDGRVDIGLNVEWRRRYADIYQGLDSLAAAATSEAKEAGTAAVKVISSCV